MKIKKIFYGVIGVCVGVLMLTAFGCRQPEEQTAEEGSSEPITEEQQNSTEVTFGDNTSTDTAVETTTTTEDLTATDTTETSETSDGSITTEEISATDITTTTESTKTSTEADTESSDAASIDENQQLVNLAEKLAEIYGTYTNKDKESYKNLRDIRGYATSKMQSWIDSMTKKSINPSADFYGVTSTAISSAVIADKESTKEVLVTIKKEEITAATNQPEISFSMLRMVFTKVEGEWKLDGAYWLNK